MNILVLCSPDTAEAQRELSGHNLFLVLDLSQSTHGLQPTAVLLLDFMYDQDLNTALRHLPDVIAFAEQVRRDHGPIDRVISFNEATHYLAAEIRERFGISGDDRRTAARYRDKWVMYQRFRDAGLPAPRTRLLPPGTTEITGMADMIVIKPREQAASRGVQLMPRRDWRGGHTRTDLLVQDRVDGDYYHFDAAFRNGVLVYCAVNRYLYHGLDWASGQAPMASVTEQRPERHTRAVNLVNQLGKAFEVGNQVLHIEAFWVPTQDDFTFIELANRPGGALIVAANIVAGNLNLEAESIRGQLTAVNGDPAPDVGSRPAGPAPHSWIVTPLPGFGPYVVAAADTSRIGWETPPVVCEIPEPGDLLHDRHRYRNPSGKFVFLGESSERDVHRVAAGFRLDVTPIDVRVPGYWKG